MSRSPSNTGRSAAAVEGLLENRLEDLLRDLGPRVRLGGSPLGCSTEAPARLPTGLPDIDRLLGDGEPGFPRGRLSEISGPASSGRTSLTLALLAQTTSAGEVAALVDDADAFDPASAARSGTQLDRVLWVRAPGTSESLRCAERLLEAHGFALVLLDLAIPNLRIAPATGPRLARAAASTGTALVVMTRERAMGTAAEVAIELAAAKSQFTGTPPLLEALEIQAALVRHRTAPIQRCATVRLRTSQAA
ncbi:MAG: hypothetical protein AAEJ52_22465 [Myxococcota bacterium]